MAIHLEYLRYLQHFHATCTVHEFHQLKNEPNLITLRHDVDYSLDLALEMAWLEYEYGFRATYYILHTQDYVHDKDFIDKCRQIQKLGHEIGVHNNLITSWVDNNVDIGETLQLFLDMLRDHSIDVKGTAAHGDRKCYAYRYSNSWVFNEAKAEALNTQRTLNAEGIHAIRPEEALTAPPSGVLEVEGRGLPLWQLQMQTYGLEYEAHRVPYDRYFTDSGGGWLRSEDPLFADLSVGRIQILMHPIWWKAKQRIYFFVSTARSGTKWLVNMLDKSSSVEAQHEFSLNHTFDEQTGLTKHKRTTQDFAIWSQNDAEVRTYLENIKKWIVSRNNDYAEANVYFAHIMPIVTEVFPEATIVHLHRDGREVVRSLLNRSWYDTPEDTKHPGFSIDGWTNMTQLEKACWYYRLTNETIEEYSQQRVVFEQLTSSPEQFTQILTKLGIRITLPEVAEQQHKQIVNANYSDSVPPFSEWSVGDQQLFQSICNSTLSTLGYTNQIQDLPRINLTTSRKRVEHFKSKQLFSDPHRSGSMPLFPRKRAYTAKGCQLERTDHVLNIKLNESRERHAYVVFGKQAWGKLDKRTAIRFLQRDFSEDTYLRLEAHVTMSKLLKGSLRILMYDASGNLLQNPHLAVLRADHNAIVSIPFSPVSGAKWFAFGFYFGKSEGYGNCHVELIRILRFIAV